MYNIVTPDMRGWPKFLLPFLRSGLKMGESSFASLSVRSPIVDWLRDIWHIWQRLHRNAQLVVVVSCGFMGCPVELWKEMCCNLEKIQGFDEINKCIVC